MHVSFILLSFNIPYQCLYTITIINIRRMYEYQSNYSLVKWQVHFVLWQAQSDWCRSFWQPEQKKNISRLDHLWKQPTLEQRRERGHIRACYWNIYDIKQMEKGLNQMKLCQWEILLTLLTRSMQHLTKMKAEVRTANLKFSKRNSKATRTEAISQCFCSFFCYKTHWYDIVFISELD